MNKQVVVTLSIILGLILSALGVYNYQKSNVLTIGLYSGSNWDVYSSSNYSVFDEVISKYEQLYPEVEIQYESGILKEDYSEWLASKLVAGESVDVFLVLPEDFNYLSASDTLDDLNKYFDDEDSELFFSSSLQAGQYNNEQLAMPFESNPTVMCVNQTLLAENNLQLPEEGWTLTDFYNICKEVTKDTDGDGVIDQYGCYNYDWLDAFYSYGIQPFDDQQNCFLNTDDGKEALGYIQKLNDLNNGYTVTSNDFDEGKVLFRPLTLAEYRTYKPYPYRLNKYSSFNWDCIEMPQMNNNESSSLLYSSLIAVNRSSTQKEAAWRFIELLTLDEEIQQDFFNSSQGASVLKSVMASDQTNEIIQETLSSNSSFSSETLNNIMNNTLVLPKFASYYEVTEKADYYLSQSLASGTVETDLISIQKKLKNILSEE